MCFDFANFLLGKIMSEIEIDDLTVINLEISKTIEELTDNSIDLFRVEDNVKLAQLLNSLEEVKLELVEAKVMILERDMEILRLKKELLMREGKNL